MVYRKFNKVPAYQKVRVGVTAHIVLGSPKKNCDGIGICRVERAQPINEVDNNRQRKCQEAKALLVSQENELILYFVKHTLPACLQKKQFAGDHFPVDAEVLLPNEITKALGLRPGTFICPGRYSVIDLGIHLSISVNISSINKSALGWH